MRHFGRAQLEGCYRVRGCGSSADVRDAASIKVTLNMVHQQVNHELHVFELLSHLVKVIDSDRVVMHRLLLGAQVTLHQLAHQGLQRTNHITEIPYNITLTLFGPIMWPLKMRS